MILTLSHSQHSLITRSLCVQRCWLLQEYLMAHMQMMGEENARLMGEVARLEAEVEVAGAEAERRGRTAAQQLGRERAKNKVQCSVVRGHSDPPPPPRCWCPGCGAGRGAGPRTSSWWRASAAAAPGQPRWGPGRPPAPPAEPAARSARPRPSPARRTRSTGDRGHGTRPSSGHPPPCAGPRSSSCRPRWRG